jgi:opacity protein-like surface antigen
MKKLFIAAITALTLTTTAIAADESKKVSAAALENFKRTYKEAGDIKWTVTTQFTKASFLMDGERVEAYYGVDGNFLAESKAVSTQDLPKAARRDLEKKYSNYTIKEVIQYITFDKVEYYVSLDNGKETKILKISGTGDMQVYKVTKK